MNTIYGVDDSKPVTPLMVRDAIVECFYFAHCEAPHIGSDEDVIRDYCKSIEEKAFRETGGDFEKPIKSSVIAALNHLAEFSKGFREQKIIKNF